jgi:hypothetical protein
MSLNQLINPVSRVDIKCDKLDCIELIGNNSLIDNLQFKTQNNDIINISSLNDKGTAGYRLTSNGDGTVSWVEGAGSAGVDYNGTDPVDINKIALYGSTNGKFIKDSSLSENDLITLQNKTQNIVAYVPNLTSYAGVLVCNQALRGVGIGSNNAGTDLIIYDDLNFENIKSIKNCLNIETQDINTNTLTSNAPNDKITLGANTNLDLGGNDIIGLSLINGIQPSGGLYSESTGYSIPSTNLTETDILGQGTEQEKSGTLTIPPNVFTALSMYSFKASGSLSAGTNDAFTLKLKSLVEDPPNPNQIITFGQIDVQISDNNLNDVWWDIMADFTIRKIGISGTAILILSGAFRYTNTADVVRTFGRNIIINSGFDTTKQNTLQLTYTNDNINPLVNFTINQSSFTKWY